MKKEIINRVLNMADLILKKHSTIRDVASCVGYSKSTVHKDLSEKLKYIDYEKYELVQELLIYNKNVRHIRGGESTKAKYYK
ncbi:MAG: sporulation transcriptional regulator SpoIIID [Anaeroplasmataceae bacterium]